ncbi:MAG: DNA polymerase III subunit delta [Lachnospiraceae bacterium]|nr:DNA polymerase III subunit delta [Lachnospiraceae bacterium]
MAVYKDIRGQDSVISQLKKTVETGQISHAYIFNGARGTGKKTAASIFARALLCEAGGSEPCDRCPSCRQALAGGNPDIKELVHEKANIVVDDIREQINADIITKPFSAARKVYIVPDAHRMNPQAQNALLKTLEEPPSYATIILVTENIDALLPTVRSRCVRRDFENTGGSVMREEAVAAIKSLPSKGIDGINALVKELSEFKDVWDEILDVFTVWYRDVLLFKSGGAKEDLIFKEEHSYIASAAEKRSYEDIEKAITAIDTARARLRSNVNFDLTMEMLMLELRG